MFCLNLARMPFVSMFVSLLRCANSSKTTIHNTSTVYCVFPFNLVSSIWSSNILILLDSDLVKDSLS